jgi:adenine-specific DNA-methyltransferase
MIVNGNDKMNDDTKMKLKSMDVAEEKRHRMKQLFPEVFTEDKVDFDALKRVLGEMVDADKERFGLNWPGKADCMKAIQAPSVATLKPCRDESLNFDETENLFIEGDNLEVLKLLQKTYFGKIKMIFIDPPYNTGNEFIYPDNYEENLDTYLSYTNQTDDEARKFSTNVDTIGRFHTNWLNMMLPRLYLARNLLCNDGLFFISIDDNEESKLTELCNHIFGEENFVSKIVWQKRTSPDARYNLGAAHDYILVYAKSIEEITLALNKLPFSEKRKSEYTNPDNDERGAWASVDLTGQTGHATSSQFYTIKTPKGSKYAPPEGRCWALAEDTFKKLQADNRIWFGKDGNSRPRQKKYLSETEGGNAWTWWTNSEVGHSQEATKELKDLFRAGDIFNNPKPTRLIERMVQLGTNNDDIILDFFAGSCTTAQAVLNMNVKNGSGRKFIVVQLPEPCTENSNARKAGFETISDIGKERIRLSIEGILKSQKELGQEKRKAKLDLGFKVFKLSPSNFKIWNENVEEFNENGVQLEMHAEHVSREASSEDILYELLLKTGFELSTKIKKCKMAGKEVFSIAEGALLICLEKEISLELIDALADADPIQVMCLDQAFMGNDQLKVNAVQTFSSLTSAQERDIVFKTI